MARSDKDKKFVYSLMIIRKFLLQLNICLFKNGLHRQKVESVTTGEIVALAGIPNPKIGETIADPVNPQALPSLQISEPTVKMQLSVNTSPFVSQEAEFSTSRQLQTRLDKEIETNVGLRLLPGNSAESVTLVGRGELHLAILIETMRREGYEFSLSRPEVVLKEIDGKICEPWEAVEIEIPESSYWYHYCRHVTAPSNFS